MVNGCRNNWKQVITGSLIVCVFALILRSTCQTNSLTSQFSFSAVYPSFVCVTLILIQLFHTRTYKQHVTSIDLDGDGYSSETEVCFICMLFQKQFIYFRSNILVTHAFHCNFQTFRGYAWKGRDCNDLYKHIHPGAR